MSQFQLFVLSDFEKWLNVQAVSRLIKLVQNHHTYIPDYSHFHETNHLALQQSMERSHLERGFTSIAQHFTIFPDGKILTGRTLNAVPAGIKGANANGICLEHLGNFDLPEPNMNPAQKETILKMNALLVHKFGLEPTENSIVYHRWYDLSSGKEIPEGQTGMTKSCPGAHFFGGNTRSAFNQNFLPLVKEEVSKLKDPLRKSAEFEAVGIVTARTLNVRLSSSASSSILTTLSIGTPVRIFEEMEGWYAINHSRSRWVKKEFIEKVNKFLKN